VGPLEDSNNAENATFLVPVRLHVAYHCCTHEPRNCMCQDIEKAAKTVY